MRLDDESWVPFDDFAQAILRSAKAAGLPRSEVMSVGRRYDAWWIVAICLGLIKGQKVLLLLHMIANDVFFWGAAFATIMDDGSVTMF